MRRLIPLAAALLVALSLALPTSGVAVAATNVTFAKNVHVPAGTTTFGGASGFNVPAGTLDAVIDTAADPSGITFTMVVDYTQDGGATWKEWLETAFSSDPGIAKGNLTATQHALGGDWPGSGMRIIVTATQAATLTVSGLLNP